MKKPTLDSHPDEHPWTEVAAAARDALARSAPADEAAPLGFPTRVVALWMERRREQAALLWQRWSFRTAAFSAALAVIAVLAARPPKSSPSAGSALLPFPAIDVPLPTENSHAP